MDRNVKKPRKPWSQEARANQALVAKAFWAKRKAMNEAAAVDQDEPKCASQLSPATVIEMTQSEAPAQPPSNAVKQPAISPNRPPSPCAQIPLPMEGKDILGAPILKTRRRAKGRLHVRKPFRPTCEVRIPDWAQGAKIRSKDLAIGQRVFHHAFYHGKLVALDGNEATVKFDDLNGDAKDVVVEVASLITLSQARPVCNAVWKRGKSWRVQRGLWLWVVRELCEHGEWKEVLEEQDNYPKSSANHYIREFKKEVAREAQARQLADKAKQHDCQTAKFGPFEAPNVEERRPIPLAEDARNKNRVETDNGIHVVPIPHKAILSFQRRNLDPQTVALFHKVEKVDKKRIAEIKDRKIDELIAEVLALTPILLPAEVVPATTVESTPVAPEAGAPAAAPLPPVDADIVARVCAHLRKQGAKKNALAAIKWIPGLTYTEQYHSALKQLPD